MTSTISLATLTCFPFPTIVLRRHGDYGEHNLNMYLTTPLFLHIASSWCDLFKANLFADLESNTIKAVQTLLDEVINGVPGYLKMRAQKQADSCMAEARSALEMIMSNVKAELQKHQKSISRALTPHVQAELRQGYEDTLLVTGNGSTKIQCVSPDLEFSTCSSIQTDAFAFST